ncbi:MAG: hypothetical protein RBU23_07875 [Candidatus Auribacterota bacterium]|nr:hypothetical protein [Candidatus Auribacterota bacterium]
MNNFAKKEKNNICFIGALLLFFAGAPALCVYAQGDSVNEEPRIQGIFDEALRIDADEDSTADIFIVDDFNEPSKFNKLGLMTNVYMMPPSRAMISFENDERDGQETIALRIKYKRAVEGGPYDKGGWCGYYTTLKKVSGAVTSYFDAGKYTHITFWVRGAEGGENFVVGLSDRHWDVSGDSFKSQEVINYLPEKRITKQWQKAKVPLKDFFLDARKLASISICFEQECFPEGNAEGYVYIDDIALE